MSLSIEKLYAADFTPGLAGDPASGVRFAGRIAFSGDMPSGIPDTARKPSYEAWEIVANTPGEPHFDNVIRKLIRTEALEAPGDRRISQRVLAERTRNVSGGPVSQATISTLMRGEYRPTLHTAAWLAEALGYHLLLGFDGNSEENLSASDRRQLHVVDLGEDYSKVVGAYFANVAPESQRSIADGLGEEQSSISEFMNGKTYDLGFPRTQRYFEKYGITTKLFLARILPAESPEC
jgi:transcriptional regulator with XRE-family HTH domain